MMHLILRPLLLGVASLSAFLAVPARALETTEFWHSLSFLEYKDGDFSTRTAVELRSTGYDFITLTRVSQKFNYKVEPWLTIGATPAFDRTRSSANGPLRNIYQLHLEATLSHTLGPARLALRNRYEVRRRESLDNDLDRFRQYLRVTFPAEFLPGIDTIGFGHEIFYDINASRLTAHRFYPLQVGFQLGETKWSSYLMYQMKRVGTTDDWRENYVVGVSGALSF